MKLLPCVLALNIVATTILVGEFILLFFYPYIHIYEPNTLIRIGEIVMFGSALIGNIFYLWRELK